MPTSHYRRQTWIVFGAHRVACTAAALLLVGSGCAASGPRLDVGSSRLWAQTAGRGEPTVVFENGGGNDASVWAGVEPEIRRRLGVRTVVYDRAGFGKSQPASGPYRIEDEATALRRLLDGLGARRPIVLVAHSYGGLVATLVAIDDARVKGLVLVDAPVPSFLDDAEVAHVMAEGPDLDVLAQANPALVRVLRAFPETARHMREVPFPPALPTIDIVAERPQVTTDAERAAWRQSHESFAAASPLREMVLARGSGHFVMNDRPDIVIDAVARMVQRIRKR